MFADESYGPVIAASGKSNYYLTLTELDRADQGHNTESLDQTCTS